MLFGASGSGKSDLALRFLGLPSGALLQGSRPDCELVSDDRVLIEARSGQLIASAPATIAGKLEVRGLGIVELAWRQCATVCLAVRLNEPSQVPRMPEPDATKAICGVDIAQIVLAPFEASAAHKLLLALMSRG